MSPVLVAVRDVPKPSSVRSISYRSANLFFFGGGPQIKAPGPISALASCGPPYYPLLEARAILAAIDARKWGIINNNNNTTNKYLVRPQFLVFFANVVRGELVGARATRSIYLTPCKA